MHASVTEPDRRWRFSAAAACLALSTLLLGSHGQAASVLVVSIDGLKPEYVLEADAHALNVPYLRRMRAQGSYARGVTGVWPTVTYPSHTTLMTGVAPAEHGIVNNEQFDPGHHFQGAWYWYADSIRVPTLWQAVQASGQKTASIGWPVTVGARGIDFLIPEYWRITAPTADLNPLDRGLIDALARPAGLLQQLGESAGPYMQGNDTTVAGDWIKARYAQALVRAQHPALLTLHLSSLDDAEHDHGVFSTEAAQSLEAIDRMIEEVAGASRAADPAAIVAVVSDHGFTAVHHEINLYAAFIKAGLIRTHRSADGATLIDAWQAQPWPADGMAAIMLHDPQDPIVRRRVAALLARLAADARNGIAAVDGPETMHARGGFPEAAFVISFKPGYFAGERLEANPTTAIHGAQGDHGYSPELAEMRSALFVMGTGVAHRDLGIIDMRRIAPTLARLLGVALPTAAAPPVDLAP